MKDEKTIILKVHCSKKEIEEYGGVKNFKELLFDILDRYACSEYYDTDLGDYSGERGG